MLARNNSRTKCNNLDKSMPWMTHLSVWSRRTITRWRWSRLFKKAESSKKVQRELGTQNDVYVNSVYSWPGWRWRTFSFPTFKSGFRCSHNGSPPVILISSLYLWYQVYFVIIIVEFLVTVLSITYLRNISWGWTVPLISAWNTVGRDEIHRWPSF